MKYLINQRKIQLSAGVAWLLFAFMLGVAIITYLSQLESMIGG